MLEALIGRRTCTMLAVRTAPAVSCGLPFEEACVRPHETAGAVRTASIVQVRRPISASSIGGWRRYERELEPLRARLEALGFPAQ